MATDNRTTAEILLDALTNGRTDVVVSDINSDSAAAQRMIQRLKNHKATDDQWRFYQRSTPDRETAVVVMSPRCKDPAPPTRQADKAAAQTKRKRGSTEAKKDGLAEWVLAYLIDPAKLHISVVPAEDIQRLHGASYYETYMTKKVQEQLGREDVRVMVREVKKDPTSKRRAYNARVIFGI